MAPSYPVNGPLRFDGERYDAGDSVEMPAAEAKPLQRLGVLGKAKAPKGDKAEAAGKGEKAPPAGG